MHTGKRPWAGLLQMQVIFAVTIRRRRLAFPPGAREAHPRFVALAEDCMAPEAEKRPSFEEVIERLKEVEGAPGKKKKKKTGGKLSTKKTFFVVVFSLSLSLFYKSCAFLFYSLSLTNENH